MRDYKYRLPLRPRGEVADGRVCHGLRRVQEASDAVHEQRDPIRHDEGAHKVEDRDGGQAHQNQASSANHVGPVGSTAARIGD